MAYSGKERRKYPRAAVSFIVSYRIFEQSDNIDITQTKNLSLGGMLLTTNRAFVRGTNLALEIRLPFDSNPIMLVGRVMESQEITPGIIYDTRIQFISVDGKHRKIIDSTIEYYSGKDKK